MTTSKFHPKRKGYTSRVRRLPRYLRALLLMTIVLSLLWLFDGEYMSGYFGGLLFLMWALFPEYIFNQADHLNKIGNLPGMLHRESDEQGDCLRLGMEQAKLSVIKKVAISVFDDDYAFIDFPYTGRFTGPVLFPIQQLDSVLQWFADNTPELEVIE